jgi:hypothetical protein
MLNKIPCVGNVNGRLARQVWVTPPGIRGVLRVRSLSGVFLDYCAAGDPGHRVDVSPVAASAAAAQR